MAETSTPPNTVVRDGAVLVRDGRIAAVGPAMDVAPPASDDVQRIDVRGGIIAPGFIDLQINGAAGNLFTDEPTEEALDAMAAALPQFGCTSFLPTLLSCSEDTTHRALATSSQSLRTLPRPARRCWASTWKGLSSTPTAPAPTTALTCVYPRQPT